MPKSARRTSNSSRPRKTPASLTSLPDPALLPPPPPALPPAMPTLKTAAQTRTRTSLGLGSAVAFLVVATAVFWLSSQSIK